MIYFVRAAEFDLDNIAAWVASRSGDTVASRVIDTLLKTINGLERFPQRGRSGRVAGTRELAVPRLPYLVIYREVGRDVRVLRVLHGATLWPQNN